MYLLLSRFLREPLVHFLTVGLLLFVVFDFLPQRDSDDTHVIQVSETQLVPLVMFRNPRLSPQVATEYLSSMDPGERDQLAEDYIREEVMYRQAVALGLDENNYSARRRLIAQLEYINQGFIYESLAFADDDLRTYHQDNRDRYFVAPQTTFTHVYFSNDRSSEEQARGLATRELEYLNEVQLPFHLAASRGDHFLYHRNYVNKNQEEVASHFGRSFAAEVFELTGDDATWRGPFQSAYGFHLLLVTTHKPGYYPELEEVSARVVDDLTRVRVREELDLVYEEMRATYDINIVESDGES